jgi:transposase
MSELQYENMLFSSDEARVSISGPDKIGNKLYYYVPDGPPYRLVTNLRDAGGTLFWGCISKSGCSKLISITELKNNPARTMKNIQYTEILDTHFRKTVKTSREVAEAKHGNDEVRWKKIPALLLQDGAKSHTAKATKAWVRNNKKLLVIVQVPPYSPDLNPIEKVWAELKRRLYQDLDIPWTDQEKVDAKAKEVWNQLTSDTEYIERVMSNLLTACKRVIAANGDFL